MAIADVIMCSGNDSGGECGVTVSKHFKMPNVPPTGAENHMHRANSPFWYSFDYGSVHFAVLSSEHDLSHSSEQYKVGQPYIASLLESIIVLQSSPPSSCPVSAQCCDNCICMASFFTLPVLRLMQGSLVESRSYPLLSMRESWLCAVASTRFRVGGSLCHTMGGAWSAPANVRGLPAQVQSYCGR